MSIFSRRGKIFSNSHWIILVTISVCIYPQVLEATIPDSDTDDNHFFITDEEAADNKLMESTSDSEDEFYRLLRESNERHESSTNRLINDEIPESLRRFWHLSDVGAMDLELTLKRGDKIRHEMLKEQSNNLPGRFSYVAREFYLSWKKPSAPTNDHRENVEGRENDPNNFMGDKEGDKETDINTTKKPFGGLWRNIITAPVGNCPPGQRKDTNGRCRRMLW